MYKPVRGERPALGLPRAGTLADREAASYVVSAAGGWDVVPPTVLRDGPAGRGTVQLWIEGLDGTDDEDGSCRAPRGWSTSSRRRGWSRAGCPCSRRSCTTGRPVVVVARGPARPGRGRGLRHRHQQLRPQGLAPRAGPRRGRCAGFDHGVSLPRGAQAADGPVGVGGHAAAPTSSWPASTPLATDLSAPSSSLRAGPRCPAGARARCSAAAGAGATRAARTAAAPLPAVPGRRYRRAARPAAIPWPPL